MKDFKFFQKKTSKGLYYATIIEHILQGRIRLSRYGPGEIVGGIDPARPNDSFTVIHVGMNY